MRDAPDTAAVAQASPLSDAEIGRIGADLLAYPALSVPQQGIARPPLLVLAVSGGVDSMALMHVVAESLAKPKRAHVLVATVDHALRPESADEARFVADEAHKLGLRHVTLVWQGAKPATGIQEAARAARYQLLADACRDQRATDTRLVTAHTLDDQAETVLMRLARGSGIEGLSGMSSADVLPVGSDGHSGTPAIGLRRPLLRIAKARLIATLRARGLAWREDPSNENPAFERVRIRKAMPLLAELGLTAEAIARSASRIAVARDAVRDATLCALGDATLVRVDPLGFVDLDRDLWSFGARGLPEAVQLRVLAAVIACVGGLQRLLSLHSLEAVAREVFVHRSPTAAPFAATLGLTKLTWMKSGLRVQREAGRNPPPPMTLVPGQKGIWDNRFDVMVNAEAGRALQVRPLAREGLQWLRTEGHVPPDVTVDVLQTVPGLWDGPTLVAAPPLAQWWIRYADAAAAAPHREALDRLGEAHFRSERLSLPPRGDIED